MVPMGAIVPNGTVLGVCQVFLEKGRGQVGLLPGRVPDWPLEI